MAYEASDSLPSLDGGQAGEIASATYIKAVAAALNQAHVSNVCQPINQAWPDGSHVIAGGGGQLCEWLVPTVSTAHTLIRFIVDADGGGAAGGTVKLSAVGSGQEKTLVFNGGRETQTVDLKVDASGEYETIRLTVLADPGSSIVLYSIDSSYRPLTLPMSAELAQSTLSDGSKTTAHPLGDQTLAENTPISAFVGHAIRETMGSLRQRRRSLGCWSRSEALVVGYQWFGTTKRPRLVMIQPGTLSAGVKIRLALRTVNTTGIDQSFSIEIREPNGRLAHRSRIVVPAGQAEAWTFREAVPVESGRIPNPRRPLTPEPYAWINVNPESLTEQALLALSAWTE